MSPLYRGESIPDILTEVRQSESAFSERLSGEGVFGISEHVAQECNCSRSFTLSFDLLFKMRETSHTITVLSDVRDFTGSLVEIEDKSDPRLLGHSRQLFSYGSCFGSLASSYLLRLSSGRCCG
jgi:hypothetical protein